MPQKILMLLGKSIYFFLLFLALFSVFEYIIFNALSFIFVEILDECGTDEFGTDCFAPVTKALFIAAISSLILSIGGLYYSIRKRVELFRSKKRIFSVMGICVIILGFFYANTIWSQLSGSDKEKDSLEYLYQLDADMARLDHLEYWTGLIEEYHEKEGVYPFQNELTSDDDIVLVRILTKAQREYMVKGGENYNEAFDNNPSGFFGEFSMQEFVSVLETGLEREIYEKYDIQNVPTKSPIGYNYFVTQKGYLLWTTCITCGVTPISTLLMDGYTPTVNIASEAMKDEVTKALTREEMLKHDIFKKWKKRGYNKAGYIEFIEEQNKNDSKN